MDKDMCKALNGKVQCGVCCRPLFTQDLYNPSSCLFQVWNLRDVVSHLTSKKLHLRVPADYHLAAWEDRNNSCYNSTAQCEEKEPFEP